MLVWALIAVVAVALLFGWVHLGRGRWIKQRVGETIEVTKELTFLPPGTEVMSGDAFFTKCESGDLWSMSDPSAPQPPLSSDELKQRFESLTITHVPDRAENL